jgi:CRISPR/Cas system-associated exonuclease Cas4 (RecB family)
MKMNEEKKRLGFSTSKIVFTGVSVITQMFWCEKKAFYSAIDNELMFYSNYLRDNQIHGPNLTAEEIDKIVCPGYIDSIKIKDGNIIMFRKKIKISNEERKIFSELTFNDIRTKTKQKKWLDEFAKKNRIKYTIINPSNDLCETRAVNTEINDDLGRGIEDQIRYAEKYPTIRYHFRWKDYIIEAIPDGIGEDFCYEFKSTKKLAYVPEVLNYAHAQVQLYAYFFKKPKIRVQVRAMDTGRVITSEEKADPQKAENILSRFDQIMNKPEKAKKVPPWRCYKCEYRVACDTTALKDKRV